MLTIAGAPWPPTSVPMYSPIAANGSTPTTFTTHSSSHCDHRSSTPPTVAARLDSNSEISIANTIAIAIFANR